MYISVDLFAEGVGCILTRYCRTDFQMLWILSDMKPSQPPETEESLWEDNQCGVNAITLATYC